MLAWQITDRNQGALATLTDRRLGRINIARNGGREASVAVALDDAVTLKVLPLRSLLKVTLNGALIFCGRITSPSFADQAGAGEGGASTTIAALDPLNHLERCFTKGLAAFTADDQSEIMAALIDHVADRDHGVTEGSLWTGGTDRDRTYFDGKQIAEALVQMSEVIGGPDFELEPIFATDGTIARLNTFEEQGDLRPATFEYGFGVHNVAGFSWEPSGEEVCNKFTAAGEPVNGVAPAYVAQSVGSQDTHGGTFERFEVVNDVSVIATLEAYAKEQVRRYAYPIDYFEITLPPQQASGDMEGEDFTGAAYGQPPVCGPNADYWIGDTITARIRRNIEVDVQGRVDELELTEDDQGAVTVKLTCAPVALDATDITGASTTATVEAAA